MDVEAAQLATQADYSMLGLFLQATLVVKLVMIGLLLASILCWAIVFEKFMALRNMNRSIDRFEQQFWSGQSLEDLYLGLGPRQTEGAAAMFVAAMREWKRSQEIAMRAGFEGVLSRINTVMNVQLQREVAGLETRLTVLATVASSAPFIGLFGTVWGIMHSFTSIAASKNTNLAVVAPGIAEALFATAIGLLAAIPAAIFYNYFTSANAQVGQRLENFADEFTAMISRQLDERM
jgi:biopolymer transport protein TolQ